MAVFESWNFFECIFVFDRYIFACAYRKYPNLVRTQVEVISDPINLVRILSER